MTDPDRNRQPANPAVSDGTRGLRSAYEAYPFLREPTCDLRCDFELSTDELASLTGLLRSLIPENNSALRFELLWVCEMIYHLNPALRAGFAITPDESEHLLSLARALEAQKKSVGFVLPAGTAAACVAHLLRVRAKMLVRLMYAHFEQGHPVEAAALDFANLLCGYFHLLALHLNAAADVAEVPFVSRAY